MNITIEKKYFIDAVAFCARFAERKMAALPTLAGIALVVEGDTIHFRATNLEVGIDLQVEGEVAKQGAVALPATVLREIAGSLGGNGSVTLEEKGDTVLITSGKAKSVIKTLPYDDFPSLPLPENVKTEFTLEGTVLKGLIAQVASCASPSTVRPELASIFLSAEGGVIKAVATDSFRLAEKKITVNGKIPPFSMLIPAKNANDMMQALPDGEITVRADEHQCSFSWKGGVMVSRLVALSYPDYAQIIPKSFTAEATLLRKDLEGSLKRVAVFSDAFQKVRVSFDTQGKFVALSAANNDVGQSDENIPASLTGDSFELSFNHRYLGTPLPLIASESVTLSAAGIGRPLVMRGTGDNTFLYLVMPMNQ